MRRGIAKGVNISPLVGDREDDADVDGEHIQNGGALFVPQILESNKI
jgi:hypothetical protein